MFRPTPSKVRTCARNTVKSLAKRTSINVVACPQRNFTSLNNTFKRNSTPHTQSNQVRCYADAKEVTVKVPDLGDSISEGYVQSYLFEVGQSFKEDDVVVQLETDKATADVRAPASGTLTAQLAKIKDAVSVGAELFKFTPGDAPAATEAAPKDIKKEEPKKEEPKKEVKKEEPKKEEPKKEAPKSTPAPTSSKSTPATSGSSRGETRSPMSRMRLKIGSRLKEAQNTYAMLTTFNEIDMSGITNLREKYKDAFQEKHGVKLGFMSAFVAASAQALKEFPSVNAVIDGEDIVHRDYVDISVAVATPSGLVVPVLRDCDQKSYADIEKNIGELGEKARKGGITMEDMKGGTFTISNGGVFGSLFGTPIINPPQSAILGMHGTFKRPVVINDQIVIRPMMYVALTYDHRIIDGREGVLFLKRIKSLVEDPAQLLLA
ncbi:2-oxoglutarate dehydrogenase E2 component [Acrasis kona]|uniref:dihydrolipoyllysine-residue succinyltransferase n=1 Tax=Acrasis kona TaxID=1008807 RepID=A0AAW2YSP3_9EUKA